MLMQQEKVHLFMEIQPINLLSKFKLVYFLNYFQWIVEIFNIKVVILPYKICMEKIEEIIYQSKDQEELLFLSKQKMLNVGLFNVIIIWVEFIIYYKIKNNFKIKLFIQLTKP